MTINYNVTGAERKRLAEAIEEFLGCKKKYMGMPSAAYLIDYIEVSKDGTVSFDDRANSEEIENLLEMLEQKGFHAEPAEKAAAETADSEDAEAEETPDDESRAEETDTAETEEQPVEAAETEEPEDAALEESDSLSLMISVPLSKVNVGHLTSFLDAKGNLIKKALGIPATPIEITESEIFFPWFENVLDADTSKAYTHFISALCEMSVNQKRVTAKPGEVENEKYAFRTWLLRLGFIGPEYKTERKILLKNLTGSSAFKSGSRSEGGADND